MKKNLYTVIIACGLMACSDDVMLFSSNGTRQVINISAEYPVLAQTRATANGFTDGDQVGIFVIDYQNGEAGEMELNGNRASNVLLTYDETAGKWSAPMTLYWASDGTPADIIGYYPFMETLESATAQPISVQRDQSTSATERSKGGYELSDLLWAKATKVTPTAETVVLKYQHAMAGLNITLERGDGFTAEEWAALKKNVLVTNTQLNGLFDLTKGKVTATTNSQQAAPINALTYGEAWRAVVVPQTVAAGKTLLNITVDGQTYQFNKNEAMTYVSGKMHNFTIEVKKRTASGDFEFNLLDEAIVPWEVDASLHDGLTRAYVVVNTLEAGSLEAEITMKHLDYEQISNLKVIGPINRKDLQLMGEKMMSLTNLNLQKAVIEDGVLTGFMENKNLHHIIFPEQGLKTIDDNAFLASGLSGNLTIPEGVECIGKSAFRRCKFTGHLSLPSTLRKIHVGAFAENYFIGELLLPEYVDFDEDMLTDAGNNPVFQDCRFSGSLNLPANAKLYPHLGFPDVTGDIVIPQGVIELKSPSLNKIFNWGIFSDGGYDGTVSIPEGVKMIGSLTFAGTKIRGEVKLPSTLKYMERSVFEGTCINKVIFNDELVSMDRDCFKDCAYLAGNITWPRKSTRIPEGTFENCILLSGIVLHKDVTTISDDAFYRCINLLSIVCENEEPPSVGENAFLGVSKANCIVEVPASAVEKYKEASGWNEFKRIVARHTFDVQPQTACALNKGYQETLTVYADGPWKVTHLPNWCELSKTNGTGKSEVQLTITSMAHGTGNRNDSIVFQMTNEGYTTYCKVSQYDYQYEEDDCLTLQKHTKGNGIDIVFVGDGWDAKSISDGSYLDLVKYQADCFFAIEPYRSMREYFDVNITFPLSQEKGVNTMYTYVNNRFGTLYGINELLSTGELLMTSSNLITETDEVLKYVKAHVPLTGSLSKGLVILVPNSTDYGGNTLLMNDGTALSICPPSENPYPRDTRGTIQHEAGGHGFGKLGDEEIKKSAFPTDVVKSELYEMFDRGWYQNLSLSGKINEVPWAEFVIDPYYSEKVDVFEGGYGYTRGIYRPELNSCMNYGIPYYNTPSRLEIWKRIKQHAGEAWTKAEFRAQDTFDWGPTEVTRSLTIPAFGQGYAESNRHVAPAVMDFKKVGREVRRIREQLKRKQIKR